LGVWSFGVFLGLRGVGRRYVVVVKEVVVGERVFHYNAIPVGLVERVVLLRRGGLDPEVLGAISRKVEGTPMKKFRVGVRGGWMRWG